MVGTVAADCQAPARCQLQVIAGDDVRCPAGTIDDSAPATWLQCKGHIFHERERQRSGGRRGGLASNRRHQHVDGEPGWTGHAGSLSPARPPWRYEATW